MRTFKEFPKESICPICGTNDNKETVLIPIVGTQDGGCYQAKPVHEECISKGLFYYPDLKLIVIDASKI